MQENTDQKNFEYGHFSHSGSKLNVFIMFLVNLYANNLLRVIYLNQILCPVSCIFLNIYLGIYFCLDLQHFFMMIKIEKQWIHSIWLIHPWL